jgi:phosphoribosylformimino-5-aminoimidazole carboxamide ribotide isomerase
VVDLDAARDANALNRPLVAAITAAVAGRAQVQTGGGVRTVADAEALAAAGVARVVMGSAALRDPALVEQVAQIVPVAVGLDHRGGDLAVHGWTESAGITVTEALSMFPAASAFVITDIGRDGMLAGPDLEGLGEAAKATTIPVIASGGISSIADVVAAAWVGCAGVITGKAIYEGRFTVADGVAALRGAAR